MRRASGRTALAGDAEHLVPVIAAAAAPDLFADPFDDRGDDGGDADGDRRPVLLLLDDGADDASIREQRARLVDEAEDRRVRVETVASEAGTDVARYAALVATGSYAAAYLAVGLGRGH